MRTEHRKLHKHDESESDIYRDLLPRPENPIGVDEAVEMFVEKVSRIEYVDEIRCFERGGCHTVWTIIDAPRDMSRLEFPIYDVQWDIWDRMDEETLDFRVVNANYYEDPSTIAQGGALLWKRPNAK